MGTFSATIEVGHPDGGDLAEVSAVVGAGAVHTMLPQSLLAQMRVQPMLERSFGFADGKEHIMGVGFCRIVWQGDEAICPVIFGPEDKYLMGATTLEIFDLAVEPSLPRLVRRVHYERPYF